MELKDIVFKGVSIDTRTISHGDLFVAIKGSNFDGNDFIKAAFLKGAKYAIVSKNPQKEFKNRCIVVKDTLTALQTLSSIHRQRNNAKVIAITGSSGKTTTKDIIASVLSQAGKTLKTKENFNNEIGTPLTLLNIKKEHEFAVVEMGMQGKGEIELLSKLAKPDIAIISNIGEAHIEKLRTKSNIAKAKSEIFKYLKKNGIAIINRDDEFFDLMKKAAGKNRIISFGINNDCDIKARNVKESHDKVCFDTSINGKTIKVTCPVPGLHNVYNCLCAIAVASVFHIETKKTTNGILSFKTSKNRMEILRSKNGLRIINDSYNANPSSMKAAIDVLSSQIGRNKKLIAILGDMKELGKFSRIFHEKLGKYVATSDIDYLISIGPQAKFIHDQAVKCKPKGLFFYFKNNEDALKKVVSLLSKDAIVLLKASRSMKFEEIMQKIVDTNI